MRDAITDSEFSPPGYALLRKDRVGSRGGGVAIFIKTGIDFFLLPDVPDTESLWCKVKVGSLVVAIGAIYRPPDAPGDIFCLVRNYIAQHRLHNGKLVVTGYFNLPHIDWQSLKPTGRDKQLRESVIDMSLSFDLTKLVDCPTRENAILDLFL